MLRLQSLFWIFICTSTEALNGYPTIMPSVSLSRGGNEIANTKIYSKTSTGSSRYRNSRSFSCISKLILFCDSEWLLYVQPALISLSFSQ